MKNYEDTIRTVFDRIDVYNAQKAKEKKVLLRVVPSVCLGCILLGIGVWKSDIFRLQPPAVLEDSTIIGEKDTVDPTTKNSTTTTSSLQETDKRMYYINRIESTVAGRFKYLDPALHYTESWSISRTAEYFGIDLSALPVSLPYSGADTFTVTYTNDGTIARDIVRFRYSEEEILLTVLASKLGAPYDCVYMLDDERVTHVGTANGTIAVLFAGTIGSSEETQPETQALLVADFEVNGVFYRVKAENMKLKDFYRVVAGFADQEE